ncbi:MAG: hemagglutinin/hemolysin-like protein [Frondihabitans sp.]|nr:hemagglutinin/hemolysin-like protein [Frondihabitans sp.]
MEQTTLYDVSAAPRPRRRVTKRFSTTPDDVLLRATRDGDRDAYGELYRRHAKAGLVAARSFSDLGEPDDLVSEAFANIYETLINGAGPTGSFRPYLYVTIRNLAHRRLRTTGREVDIDPETVRIASADDPVHAALEASLTTTAFRSLPERWQTVLWYTEVERMTPRQAGELMGIGANAVSALSFRARAALRQAWVQGHVTDTTATGTHREALSRLAGWSLGTLSERDEALVDNHLKTCTRCRLVAEELEDVSSRLAIILLPLILGGTAALLFQRQIASGSGSATAASAGFHLTALSSPTRIGWIAIAGATVIAASAVVVANALVTAPVVETARGGGHSATTVPTTTPTTPAPVASQPAKIIAPPPVTIVAPNPPSPRQTSVPPAAVSAPSTPSSTPPVVLTADGAPVVTSPSVVLTRESMTTVRGTAPIGSTILVGRGGTSVGTARVDASGSWTWTATKLAEGRTTFTFTATRSGDAPSAATKVVVTRDSIAPASPVITSEAANTQVTPYRLAGTAEPLSTVTVESTTGGVLKTIRTDAAGQWSTGTIAGFTPAMSSLLVTATDAAGNVSQATTAGPFAFVPVFTDPSGQTYSTPTVSFDLTGWPGSSVTLTLNGVTQGAPVVFPRSGAVSRTVSTTNGSALPAGDYSVTATYTDGTNTSTATATWTFTVAPG